MGSNLSQFFLKSFKEKSNFIRNKFSNKNERTNDCLNIGMIYSKFVYFYINLKFCRFIL